MGNSRSRTNHATGSERGRAHGSTPHVGKELFMQRSMKRRLLVTGILFATAEGTFAAGSKRAAEECVEDGECARGHGHTKENGKKVCVDCSASRISDLRGQIQRHCKDEDRKCTSIPGLQEVSESFFTVRMEAADRCIAARKDELEACWNGGDQGHKDAIDEAERSRKHCYELNTRKGNGGIYACSDSTYTDRADEVTRSCDDYGRACESWSEDDQQVDCDEIDKTMVATNRCVSAVERLDNDCLPRLSSWREHQFSKAKKAYDYCKEVLEHKKAKGLCK